MSVAFCLHTEMLNLYRTLLPLLANFDRISKRAKKETSAYTQQNSMRNISYLSVPNGFFLFTVTALCCQIYVISLVKLKFSAYKQSEMNTIFGQVK